MAGPSGFRSLVAASFRSHVSKLGFPEFPESLGWKGLLELGGGREGGSRQVKGHMTGQNESELNLAPITQNKPGLSLQGACGISYPGTER